VHYIEYLKLKLKSGKISLWQLKVAEIYSEKETSFTFSAIHSSQEFHGNSKQ
jgi:hypothetical protein